ncbi:hypothetical protein [Sphingomonas sp. OTU376]|uniref:hypothetical protein n=1 Tax=Sphingomonas sp. OTU376 TaxID=3043863 RepID=UPI00313F027E
MKAAFWRFAHSRYHSRPISRLTDFAALTWAFLFVFVYSAALLAGWRPSVPETMIGLILIGAPLMFGIVHRRIRLEAAKGPDALYRKRVEASR